MIGNLWLKDNWVNLFLLFETTACMHIGLYLFTFKSKTYTFPSEVTAAKTVDEYGAHWTSPTGAPTSKTNRGSLKIKYDQQKRKYKIWIYSKKLLQITLSKLSYYW